MRNKGINRMLRCSFLLLFAILLTACEKSPITVVLHEPIYPTGSEAVTYTATKVTDGSISSAKLYEQVNTINSSGTVTSTGTETLLETWSSPSGDLSFTKPSGHGDNKLVTYRFEITTPDESKSFTVSYVTRPYPVANMPAPVYAQGDPDDVFDVVFIPDTDITSLTTFYGHCRGDIKDAFFKEEHTRFWRRQYNFYINSQRGTATDFDRRSPDLDGPHQPPSNNANLAFAEGRVLLHEGNLRDWAGSGLFSSEMQNRGTIMHEAGHPLYNLKDEYPSGTHSQSDVLPNNWSSLANAQDDGDGYGSCKSAADAVEMGSSGWYRLCHSDCLMGPTDNANLKEYDCPCQYRITYTVFDNAIN